MFGIFRIVERVFVTPAPALGNDGAVLLLCDEREMVLFFLTADATFFFGFGAG